MFLCLIGLRDSINTVIPSLMFITYRLKKMITTGQQFTKNAAKIHGKHFNKFSICGEKSISLS